MSLPRSYDKAHFIVFSNDAAPFRQNAETYCKEALAAGFDSATSYTQEALRETRFWADNAEILEQPRGAGYWLWKPYILLEKLREVGPNDVVVYNDVGRYTPGSFPMFPSFPHAALELCARLPKRHIHGFSTNWAMQGTYIKRDCLIRMDADHEAMHHAPLISACPLIYMPSVESFTLLEQWLELARDPHLLTDIPDELGEPHPGFTDHRHDQAIASLLVHQSGGHHVDFSKRGINSLRGEMERKFRDVARMHIHIGYFSQIIEHALPDGFLEEGGFIPEQVSHFIRYAVEGEEIHQLSAGTPLKVFQDHMDSMIRSGDFQPDKDHIIRLFTGHFPIISSQLHELEKVQGIDAFWEHLEASIREACRNIPENARLYTAAERSIESVQEALDAFPEVRDAVAEKMSWSFLNADAREAFKARQKAGLIANRQKGMKAFINDGARALFIDTEAMRARHIMPLRLAVNEAMESWLEKLGREKESAKDVPGEAEVDVLPADANSAETLPD